MSRHSQSRATQAIGITQFLLHGGASAHQKTPVAPGGNDGRGLFHGAPEPKISSGTNRVSDGFQHAGVRGA